MWVMDVSKFRKRPSRPTMSFHMKSVQPSGTNCVRTPRCAAAGFDATTAISVKSPRMCYLLCYLL